MPPTVWIVAALIAGPSAATPINLPPSQEDLAEVSPERKLAMLDAQAWVPALDPRVIRARILLDRLDGRFAEDEAQLVGLAEKYQREIREKGRQASATEIIEGALAWSEALPEWRRRRLSRAVGLYARAREEGLSHVEAVEMMKQDARNRARMRLR